MSGDYEGLVTGLMRLTGVTREVAESALRARGHVTPDAGERRARAFAESVGVPLEVAKEVLADLQPSGQAGNHERLNEGAVRTGPGPSEEHVREVARIAGASKKTARAFLMTLAGKHPVPATERRHVSDRLPRPKEADTYNLALQEDGPKGNRGSILSTERLKK